MRSLIAASMCGIAALTIGVSSAGAADPHQFEALSGADKHWDMLNQYCADCHNFEDWAGGVAFDVMSPEGVPENAETWEKVVEKLRGHQMPPPDKARPSNREMDAFVTWMENYLDEAGAKKNYGPGHVALHRMNRKEYANAVQDLLDLEVDAAALLPRDDASDGFDNIASVLQVSPAFAEQYVSAARAVAVKAVGDPNPLPSGTVYTPAPGKQQTHVEGLPLGTRGGMAVEHLFPVDGEYEVNIADMAAALWVLNQEFENTVVVLLDGKQIYETTIGGEQDIKAIDQNQDPAVDAINKRLKNIRFTTTSGKHTVGVTFKARTFAESDDRLRPQVPGGGQDRVLRVSQFEVRGPFNSQGISTTPAREKIFICHPDDGAAPDECAEKIVTNLAEKAYRRDVTESDLKPLMGFYEKGKQQDGFETGVRMALTGILASPHFLYRPEPAPANVAEGETYELNSRQLASRLSFFLWSSVPDAELRQLAEAGKLTDEDVLEEQVMRMLQSPKAKTLASNFAYQWFHLSRLDEVEPDPGIFPYASGPGDQRANFKKEIALFVDDLFRNDRPVTELMTADFTYLNESLALHYGIKDVKGDHFRKVSLADHPERWGILGKGGVLMASSYPNRTAPVLRGAWIMERIMGTPPAAPPPNVEALKENEVGAKEVLTVRELMEQHRANPSCNSCHGILDPLGLALENFDAVGSFRERDRFSNKVIDASGELPDGTQIQGPIDLRKALIDDPEQFVQTLTKNLMTYALGRTVEYHDMPTVRRIVEEVAEDDYHFSDLVMAIVESDQFQKQTVPEVETQEASLHLESDR